MGEKTLKEKTATGLLWGAVNNIMTQLLMLLIGIILGRLLSPAEYGIIGLLAIFSAIAATLQDSGFSAALTNLKEATNRDYNAIFWFSTCMSVILYIVLFFCAPLIADFFHQPILIELSRLVFASFVMAGIGTAHSAYMFRNMMNREKALVNTLALLFSGVVGIILAFNGYSYWSLAWQQFVYICIIDMGRLYYVPWLPNFKIDLSPIREMFGFSSKILITNMVNQVNNNLLSFVFGRLYTAKELGNYTQAMKWNAMGYGFVSGTIQQVAQPVLASVSEDDEGRQVNIFRKMLRFTAFLSMPTMLGLAFIAEFVTLLLGDKWEGCVPLLRILCISGAFIPIHTLYQNLFISHGRSNTYMWCSISQVIIQLAIVLSFSSYGILPTVTVYAAMLILWICVWQLLAGRLLSLTFRHLLLDVCPFLLITVGCIAIAYLLTSSIEQPILLIIARVLVTAMLYVCMMRIIHVTIFYECIAFFMQEIKK